MISSDVLEFVPHGIISSNYIGMRNDRVTHVVINTGCYALTVAKS